MTERIRIAIVDDHPMFRAGLIATLRRFPDLRIVDFGATAEDAIRLAGGEIDIMLLDIGIPGGGLNAATHIIGQFPGRRIVFLTGSNNEDDAISAMTNGARGYLLKGTTGRELVDVIRLVHGGGQYFAPELALRALAGRKRTEPAAEPGPLPKPRSELTEREVQILELAARGLKNGEIASELGLSLAGIKYYITRIVMKLGVRNRTEAVVLHSKRETS